MARQYSRKTFLRHVPHAILKEYFAKMELLQDVEFDRLKAADIDLIAEKIDGLSRADQATVETDFQQINQLACPLGVEAILEEATTFWGLNWSDQFAAMRNHHEKAFGTFLNHPRIFRAAGCFEQMDRIISWQKCFVGENLTPRMDEELKDFEQAVSQFYRKQGRGRFCHVDNYLRQSPDRHCYFAYPEDHPSTDMGFDDDGTLRQRPRRSAFEIIFVYRPDEGMLELHGRRKRDEVEALQDIFCRTVVALDELPPQGSKATYDLSVLKRRDFPTPTDPDDGVLAVEVRKLGLKVPGGPGRKITLEADSSPHVPRAVYDLMRHALNRENISMDEVSVTQAKLRLTFARRGGGRQKKLTFEIIYPHRCTLADDHYDQIAKKCLKLWKIVRD